MYYIVLLLYQEAKYPDTPAAGNRQAYEDPPKPAEVLTAPQSQNRQRERGTQSRRKPRG